MKVSLNSIFVWSLAGSLFFASCSKEAETTKPVVTDMTVSVYASATLQPKDLYNAHTEVAGIIEKIYVKEGDTVSKNQIIAKIRSVNTGYDVSIAELNEKLAENNLKGYSSRLTSLESDLATLQNQLFLDSTNYFRQKDLFSKDVGTKQDLENREIRYQTTLKQFNSLKAIIKQTKLELKNSYDISRNTLAKSRSVLNNFVVLSTLEGKVYKINKNEGENISPQESLAQVGDKANYVIQMQVDEVDIAKLNVGQKVVISLDAYPGKTFFAKLVKLYPSKDLKSQTFKVEAVFDTPPGKLYAGLAGEANIIIEKKKNVLMVPLDYLSNENEVTLQSGEVKKLKLGKKNLQHAEVLSGLDSTAILVKPEGK